MSGGRSATGHVAFLRAVNVGGRTVRKEQLVDLLTAAGFDGVTTFLASGNVVYRGQGTTARARRAEEELVARTLEEGLGHPVPAFVRDLGSLRRLLVADPLGAHRTEGATWHIGFLARRPSSARVHRVEELSDGANRLTVIGTELHWMTAGTMTASGVEGPVLERAVGVPMTLRNERTVRRLVERFG